VGSGVSRVSLGFFGCGDLDPFQLRGSVVGCGACSLTVSPFEIRIWVGNLRSNFK